MATKERTTVAEKLACYEPVVEIIEDRLALEAHMKNRDASFKEILFAREDAYCSIVSAVFGPDALFMTGATKTPRPHKRRSSRKSTGGSARKSARGSPVR
jgi:hypothetical protein